MVRQLTDDEIEKLANPLCEKEGWAQFNINPAQPTALVAGSFSEEGEFQGFLAMQLFPILGPMAGVEGRKVGVSKELVEWMENWFKEINPRGYLVIADSPVTEHLARSYGLRKLESPVYMG